MWSNRGEVGSYLMTERFHITNRYKYDDPDTKILAIRLKKNPLPESIQDKIHIGIKKDIVTLSAENTFGAFPDMFFRFIDCNTETIFQTRNEKEIPLREGIELIEFRGPNPTTRLFKFVFEIDWEKTTTTVDEKTEKVTTETTNGTDEDSFSLRINYDNSIAGQVINEIISGRRQLNQARTDRLAKAMMMDDIEDGVIVEDVKFEPHTGYRG